MEHNQNQQDAIAVDRGDYDSFIRHALRRGNIADQYEEVIAVRKYLKRQLRNYDSTRSSLLQYVRRSCVWSLDRVRAGMGVVHIPRNKLHGCRNRFSSINALEAVVNRPNSVGSLAEHLLAKVDASSKQRTPEQLTLDRELRLAITAAMKSLKPRERSVVLDRLEFAETKQRETPLHTGARSLAAIGKELGLKSQWTGRIEADALRQLREILAPVWEEYKEGKEIVS